MIVLIFSTGLPQSWEVRKNVLYVCKFIGQRKYIAYLAGNGRTIIAKLKTN